MGLDDKTFALLKEICAASKRPRHTIINLALRDYLSCPERYKDHIRHVRLPNEFQVRLNARLVEFISDEAFLSPTSWRKNFVGIVVTLFLHRQPKQALIKALEAYVDVIAPILRRGHG